MTGEPPPIAIQQPGVPPFEDVSFDTPPRRRGGSSVWIALIAFVLGIVAMIFAWPVIERWRGVKPTVTAATPIVVNPAAAIPSAPGAPAPITIEGLAAREAALDLQLRSIETRLSYADAASRGSAANAARAERLLIAFAARRRIDRGAPLDQYEPLLRTAFGGEAPQAVGVVIGAARAPLTLGDLREALDTISPKLMSGSTRDGVGTAMWREFSNLIVLRRDTSPSPRGVDRLDRARRLLDAGQVEAALAEVARMPGAPEATSWIDAAKRYVETRNALNRLELVALSRPAPRSASPGQAQAGTPAAPLPTQ